MMYFGLIKKIKCPDCDATGRDLFDGGQCLECHGEGVREMSIFKIWKLNKLREELNEKRIVRIT